MRYVWDVCTHFNGDFVFKTIGDFCKECFMMFVIWFLCQRPAAGPDSLHSNPKPQSLYDHLRICTKSMGDIIFSDVCDKYFRAWDTNYLNIKRQITTEIKIGLENSRNISMYWNKVISILIYVSIGITIYYTIDPESEQKI